MRLRFAAATLLAIAGLAPCSFAQTRPSESVTLRLELAGDLYPVTLDGGAAALLHVPTIGSSRDPGAATLQVPTITLLRNAGESLKGGTPTLDSRVFLEWWESAASGSSHGQRSVALSAVDPKGGVLLTLELGPTWLTGYSIGSAVAGDGSAALIEELTLAPSTLVWPQP